MATSKSPLMPIDSSRSMGAGTPAASHSSFSSRSRRNYGRASSGVSGTGGSVISPTTLAARHRGRGFEEPRHLGWRRRRTSWLPPRGPPGSAVPARCPASAAAASSFWMSSTLSTDCTIAKAGPAFRALFVCRWPSRCHLMVRSVVSPIFCSASWTRFSPKSRWPAAYAVANCFCWKGFRDRDQADGGGVAAGCPGRRRHAGADLGQPI